MIQKGVRGCITRSSKFPYMSQWDKFLDRVFRKYVFPNALPKIQGSLAYGSRKKDIVVILGWGGAKHANFNKILNFYHSKDITVICSVMPLYVSASLRKYYETELVIAVQTIREKADPSLESKLYGHVFSNNGAWALATLSQRSDFPAFDKLVIDSAPAFHYEQIPISSEVLMHTLVITSVLLGKPQYEGHPAHALIKSGLYICVPFWRAISKIQLVMKVNIIADFLQLNILMRDKSPHAPTFFVYSTGDKLIPADSIKEFKKVLEGRNIPTYEKVFGDDVAHTGSFFKYPEEYKQILTSFFDLKKAPPLTVRYLRI